ncbi:two-component sensor histidine kinase [Micromonospora zingiberis]|uniref:histidine kinase n=1 Tax=Micromonospora zingiberis TaxID=2053011 RepID=A0A4R0GU17_9ACTN|nr:histidine kinase [Micromonospora zingiberis]TCC00473.1 two-component sensor histidine kinase [Micromonospora zingiberis]
METRNAVRFSALRQAVGRPLLLDLLLAVVLSIAVLRKAAEDGQPAFGDMLIATVAFVAVLLRRIRPWLALGISTVATAGAIWHGVSNPGLIIAIGVITYSIAAHTDRRRGWTCAVAASSVVYLTGLVVAPDNWWRLEVLGVFAWIFLAAAVGDARRTQRAYILEVEARAHRAEQTRDEEARRRVVEERLRIARELHDVVAHHIAVINVQAGAAAHVLERQPERIGPVLAHIREASDTVLKEIQTVVGMLRGPGETESTEPTPGLAQLPELLAGLAAAGFRVRHQQRGPARELPALVDLAAYRIVQEALTNAHRYGLGTAGLLVEYTPGGVVLDIDNEIRPFPPASGAGYGLVGMHERAASAGGRVSAGPTDDGRFRVHAALPTDEPRHHPADPPAPLACAATGTRATPAPTGTSTGPLPTGTSTGPLPTGTSAGALDAGAGARVCPAWASARAHREPA